jgi:hypothetical protein
MRGPFFKINVRMLRETEAAVLVRTIDGHEVWIPESQIHEDSEVYVGCGNDSRLLTLVCSRWIAEQKGIEDEGEEYEP